MSRGFLLTLVLFLGGDAALAADGLRAAALAEAPPSEIAAPVRALLGAAGVRVDAAGATLDFWWATALPVSGGPPAWAQVAEGTIVGAVRVGAQYRDIRGRTIKPGVYTLRYGIQPANGDHLGVSPFREFFLLSPAPADTDPKATGHEGAVDLSKQTIGGSHPAVWSLDPPSLPDGAVPLSVRANDAGHEAVVFEVPTSSGTPLRFGLILIGKIEA